MKQSGLKAPIGSGHALLALLALSLAACSTVATRVESRQALFDSLDTETRQTLLSGKTRLGYTMDMTYIALGSPDEVRRKQTASGETVTWVYQYSYPTHHSSHSLHFQSHFHHGHHHAFGHFYDPFFYTYEPYDYVQRDYLHVVFVNGRVASIEQIE